MARDSTLRQKSLAKNLVSQALEHRFNTLKELLVASGYSVSSAESVPQFLISQKGVQQELIRLGYHKDAVKAVLSEILLLGTEQGRLKSAEIISKIEGFFAPEQIEHKGFIAHLVKELEDDEIIRRTTRAETQRQSLEAQ